MNTKPEAFYVARNKVLRVVMPENHGVPTIVTISGMGKREARKYCEGKGYEVKF